MAEFKRLVLNGGHEMVEEGKSQWPDFVTLVIVDHKEAFNLAMDILRQVEAQQFQEDKRPISLSLPGQLESTDD
ncbi:MAG: hypothetical protein PHE17_17790 [Thiothrix sp.]|uniref:hypothetical protein n=1 Tax=Thiothrix sp. TaxID=1032 RepID=UPI002636E12B|nr:hypothetical protein [Thiothrix sp.]MDD5394874.1 hypothetical protein [Thiothrix sp.]